MSAEADSVLEPHSRGSFHQAFSQIQSSNAETCLASYAGRHKVENNQIDVVAIDWVQEVCDALEACCDRSTFQV